uniref:Ascorbate peroxidase n=1 Tax=Caligus rogercresseyi TaxID=217165 RepID=C1BNK9_CALRO|nr:ascorbate peroxidase precursor [Caligus rogercresseyi]
MKAHHLLLFFLVIPARSQVLDQTVVDKAMVGLVGLINSTLEDGVRVLVPSIVRLVFHDCVDGCDACFNADLIANRGLMKPVNALEPLYQNFKDSLSRADFWALASKIAIQLGVYINNRRCKEKSCYMPKIDVRFRFGRKDCASSPVHSNDTFIPSPFSNSSSLFPWFKENFNFKPNQVVAIMGMHTLGKAGSPFNDTWENGSTDGISNFYFRKIADPNHCWVQEYVTPERSGLPHKAFFWRTDEFKGFALPVDMTLFKAIQVNETTGESSCTYHDCKRASTMGMFKRYASDGANWARHIRHLFPRIIEKTSDKLRWPRRPRSCVNILGTNA